MPTDRITCSVSLKSMCPIANDSRSPCWLLHFECSSQLCYQSLFETDESTIPTCRCCHQDTYTISPPLCRGDFIKRFAVTQKTIKIKIISGCCFVSLHSRSHTSISHRFLSSEAVHTGDPSAGMASDHDKTSIWYPEWSSSCNFHRFYMCFRCQKLCAAVALYNTLSISCDFWILFPRWSHT